MKPETISKPSTIVCSTNHLKQLTGETPVGFIPQHRLKRAALLLRQNRFTVSEVMYQVGFSSPSYFTKIFTKEFGMSPKEYMGGGDAVN